MKNKEIWKDVVGYEGIYQVSSMGNVRSIDREIVDVNGNIRKYTGNTMKLELSKEGYWRVGLNYKGSKVKFLVHRLVAMAFIPNPNNLPEINHKNEIKNDNRVGNLEWCTSKYNSNYGSAKYRNIEKIRKKVAKYSKCGKLIKEYDYMSQVKFDGYDQGAVSKCCNGIWEHYKGYVWRFVGND